MMVRKMKRKMTMKRMNNPPDPLKSTSSKMESPHSISIRDKESLKVASKAANQISRKAVRVIREESLTLEITRREATLTGSRTTKEEESLGRTREESPTTTEEENPSTTMEEESLSTREETSHSIREASPSTKEASPSRNTDLLIFNYLILSKSPLDNQAR